MWKQKVSASVANNYPMPTPEILKVMKTIGFEAVAPEWNNSEDFEKIMVSAKECGIEIASVHAPFDASPKFLWKIGDECDIYLKKALQCISDCAKHGVDIVVMHSWDSLTDEIPQCLDFSNYDKIVDFAANNKVRIAFENVTYPEIVLKALLERYNTSTVGFCWDAGHEQCFSPEIDLLGMFGDRLIATHISDNLGISSYDGTRNTTDDLHLLPGDGIADWDKQIERLKKASLQNILNLEIARGKHKFRLENFKHRLWSIEEYYTVVYQHACKLAAKYISR